jgi:hypothetical protein
MHGMLSGAGTDLQDPTGFIKTSRNISRIGALLFSQACEKGNSIGMGSALCFSLHYPDAIRYTTTHQSSNSTGIKKSPYE